jgi:hypothetical protein
MGPDKNGGWGLGAGGWKSRRVPLLIGAGILTLVPHAALAQCAMCARALQSEEGRQMISAFRSGILLMLVVPFALVAIVGILAVRRFQPARRAVDGSTADARRAGTTLASAVTANSVPIAAAHATGSMKLTP